MVILENMRPGWLSMRRVIEAEALWWRYSQQR
jgi:hypothetical protein